MKFINHEFKRKNCRLCGSDNLKNVYSFNKNPVGDDYLKNYKKVNKYDLKLNICKNCKFVQLSNVIDPKVVYGEYLYVTQTSHGLSEHFKRLSKYLIESKIVKKKTKVLEIGSNDGTLLKFFKKYCDALVAVDPAAHLFIDKKITNIGDHFSYQLSKKILKQNGKFQTIIANNVLANIDDLNNIFKGVKNIIDKNGHLIIETFSLYGVLKKNLIDNIYHEHLSYFTIESLKKFAKKYNFYLKDVKFLEVKGGSLRFIFKEGYLKESKKIFKSIEKEKRITNNIERKFKNLQKQNNENSIRLNSFLKNKKKQLKNVAGFGASVGTTTLIYDFKLENKINYIFDNEKRRFNLYCPGTKIKVLNPNLIKKYDLDYIVIFAWRYADIIIKRNKHLFNKKTKFVLPLPKFKIL